jgi:hypothetical protein
VCELLRRPPAHPLARELWPVCGSCEVRQLSHFLRHGGGKRGRSYGNGVLRLPTFALKRSDSYYSALGAVCAWGWCHGYGIERALWSSPIYGSCPDKVRCHCPGTTRPRLARISFSIHIPYRSIATGRRQETWVLAMNEKFRYSARALLLAIRIARMPRA